MRRCCNGVASQEKEINYDQHNAASPLYSFFKQPIINTLKKFHFRNIRLRYLNLFLLEHRLLEDVFLGAPSEDRPQQTECIWRILSKSSFGSFFSCCVPEETHIDADYDWKTTQSSNTFLKKRIWRVLSRSSFGSLFLAVLLKKRTSTLITTRKQHKVLKVRQISVYALTVRLSLWISALVHEVSDRQQSIRGKEEWNGTWVR